MQKNKIERPAYALRQSTSDFLTYPAAPVGHPFSNGLQTLPRTDLHEDLDLAGARAHVRAVEEDDVGVGGGLDDVELSEKLLHGCLAGGDCFTGHHEVCAGISDFVDGAASALAEAGELDKDSVGEVCGEVCLWCGT